MNLADEPAATSDRRTRGNQPVDQTRSFQGCTHPACGVSLEPRGSATSPGRFPGRANPAARRPGRADPGTGGPQRAPSSAWPNRARAGPAPGREPECSAGYIVVRRGVSGWLPGVRVSTAASLKGGTFGATLRSMIRSCHGHLRCPGCPVVVEKDGAVVEFDD